MTPAERFRQALAEEQPLQIVGAINAYAALQAEQAGFRSLYLSGAGVANASYGVPDLGLVGLEEVAIDAGRIAATVKLPLLVDIDTGYGSLENLGAAIRKLTEKGVAAVHLEDQVDQKRCGHRPNKQLVSADEMVQRIQSALEARGDSDLFIMARSDALAVEGFDALLARAQRYIAAGADGIFLEAMHELDQYRRAADELDVPLLANLTEFGQTPLFELRELQDAGIRMALYPLSAFRSMSRAAEDTYAAIRKDGTQRSVLDRMQSRQELYKTLDYLTQEKAVDSKLASRASKQEA